jgi:PPK2 family polyphosphate:nucleotide phosphotransferase
MITRDKLIEKFRVQPGKKFRLQDHDPGWAGDKDVPVEKRKEFAKEALTQDVSELAEAQELLYADDSWSLLAIFQAMDAAGKDSTIKHVMSGINPQGCQVYSFKHPSSEELDHDFLWRCSKCLPERGRIGIFNRSYYEEVLITKVHPELIDAQRIPGVKPGDKLKKEFWEHRYEDINGFERHLVRNGTAIVKLFLHLSPQEQAKRFLKRLNDPEKHWKFAAGDLVERGYWNQYQQTYEECLAATSTEEAPWYVIPADHKWVTRASVAAILNQTIRGLDLNWPKISKGDEEMIDQAREQLEAEK